MRIKIYFILLLAFCWKTLFSQQIDVESAVAAAKTELYYTKGYQMVNCTVNQFDSNGHTLLFEIIGDNGMTVLVSGNRLCIPVVARFPSSGDVSVFDTCRDLPYGLKMFIQDYKNQVEYSFKNPWIESTHDSEWTKMINGENIYTDRDMGGVDSLLTTKWGQSGHYNYYIPRGDTCSHCKVGCVAVAMAQIMNYWKWPVLCIDKWQFDWCNMADSLLYGSPNFTLEKNAVARLLERCAVTSRHI